MFGHQKKTTLNVLISAKNNLFYYQDTLAQDGSNFKAGYYRSIISWDEYLSQNYSEVFYVLKIEKKDSLNSTSKRMIQYFEKQKNYKTDTMTVDERTLVKATESVWALQK
jgi:hypothetical protein